MPIIYLWRCPWQKHWHPIRHEVFCGRLKDLRSPPILCFKNNNLNSAQRPHLLWGVAKCIIRRAETRPVQPFFDFRGLCGTGHNNYGLARGLISIKRNNKSGIYLSWHNYILLHIIGKNQNHIISTFSSSTLCKFYYGTYSQTTV